jgi:hypothetical protein
MKYRIALSFFFIIISFMVYAQKVSNVRFEQVGKQIHIYYDLEGKGVFNVSAFYGFGGLDWWNLSTQYTYGDIGFDQLPGKNKKIIFDAGKNKIEIIGNIYIRIKASPINSLGNQLVSSEVSKVNYSKFLGKWYNRNNICDSIEISTQENILLVKLSNGSYPAINKNGILEINCMTDTIPVSMLDSETILLGNAVYLKQLKGNTQVDLSGIWHVADCSHIMNIDVFKVYDNRVSIYFGSPLMIYAKLIKKSAKKYNIFFISADGTISMSRILADIFPKIEYNKPIGELELITSNDIKMEWFGVSLKGESENWLRFMGQLENFNDAINTCGEGCVYLKKEK